MQLKLLKLLKKIQIHLAVNRTINPFYFCSLKSALKVEIIIIIRKTTQTKFIVFQLVKLINIPADKLATA